MINLSYECKLCCTYRNFIKSVSSLQTEPIIFIYFLSAIDNIENSRPDATVMKKIRVFLFIRSLHLLINEKLEEKEQNHSNYSAKNSSEYSRP